MNTDELAKGDVAAADAIFDYIKELQFKVRIFKNEVRNIRAMLQREKLKHAETRSDLVAFKNACVRSPAGSLILPTKRSSCKKSVKKPLSLNSEYLLSLKLCRSVLLL